MFWKISLSFILCSFNLMINAQQLAFPGAEGFGRFASGGRGGTVYRVTNLNDTGSGSFRDAVSQTGRTVVFDVAGVIKIKEKIAAAPGITIAGQTAPGSGITVYGNGISFGGNSIIRFIRFRGSIDMPKGACTVVADDLKDIIFDHVSIQWGRWDNLHIKNSTNITLQYCLIGEGIDPQRFGALLENPVDITVHHCLWTGNQSRNPKAKAKIEYINNVVYNWGKSAFVGGHSATDHYQDLVGNYFIAGPSSTDHFLDMFTATDHVYHKDNYVDLNKDGKVNGRLVTDEDFIKQTATLVKEPSAISRSNVTISAAVEAWKVVLAQAGSSLKRDAVDKRIIGYFKSLGKKGQIFKTEVDAGGQPEVKQETSKLKDTDGDGIPDDWENKNRLNLNDAADGSVITLTGFTNLENFINSLIK
ncbi:MULTISPECIES: pectate lyase family protein [Chryseobacterium]|uniref:Pectate lyase n=1 Tax=Chryseobacterium limigenitum TaxID=1612149 RepID=A0A1K2ISC6_9FLAO|nr:MULTISPECIES: hypothetical protein [Chryseobacterium]MDQ0593390.1 hypothetical protein [Chryseobacterium ginsenosidimutans]SFZ95341.1 Pectate lyase [Chryseobacterium limigenitum]VXC00495.1 Pectate lyase [Chryseobacterium sp. 8AT]